MKKIFFSVLFVCSSAFANVIGTEYQNFNPDISGVDFTTVHSSETVKQCRCNLGLFFNYAKNTLTYSDTFYATNTDLKGVRANDYMIGADLYASFGINSNWDIGIALPFIVTANNDDPYGVVYFDKFGLTEIRPMTKYRFTGDDSGGIAVILSANFNTISSNPLAGDNPGPSFNLELAADDTTAGGIKYAGNIGFRKRSPGSQMIDPSSGLLVPFVPYNDAMIISGALAKHFDKIKSDVVAELKGSVSGRTTDDSAKRSQGSMEWGLGIRHDWTADINLQGGLGTKLADAQSSPDFRAFVGINYQTKPICGTATVAPKEASVELPTAVVKNHPQKISTETNLNMQVTALNPANYAGYRWKLGQTKQTNCYEETDYSAEVAGDQPIGIDISQIPDGGITLCALAKSNDGVWQPLSEPTIVNWFKGEAPVAVVENVPQGVSDQIDMKLKVTSTKPEDFAAYRWKIGPAPEMNCNDEDYYSAETAGDQPMIVEIGQYPDGGITLCVVAKNKAGIWQPFTDPTYYTWDKKRGYELFRLNANILFDFDKADLQERAFVDLEKIHRHLNKKPFARCIVEGHTDSVGTDEYNYDLSTRRAETVRNHMIKTYSFEPDKFTIKGMGETTPVDTNETAEGRARNRRVEFKVYRQ